MEVVIVPDAATIGELAADAVVALLARKPTAVLGLATGSSPLVVYAELVRRYDAGEVSFARSRGFLLDEYVGLPAEHPQRYRSVIRRELDGAGRLRTRRDRRPGRPGRRPRLRCAPTTSERITDAGGVDLQLLGVGSDGHVALQRARLLAELADPDQDPDRAHPRRQRAVLRADRTRCRTTCSPRGWAPSSTRGTSC